jgi:hypothetical protein
VIHLGVRRIIDIAGLNARLNGNLAIILHLPGEVGTQYVPVCLSLERENGAHMDSCNTKQKLTQS